MTTLDKVPLEVLEDIVCLAMSIGVNGLAGKLAPINSVWQSIIERQGFQELRLQAEDIAKTMRILRNRPERFNLVRCLVIFVALPTYTAVNRTVIESSEDRFRNDLVFSKSMNIVLTHLSNWPPTGRTLEL
ncbi:hypothetical protein F4680DRAFT_465292 [Xylaria scruposa]|nr:hypothetical protein F4680DRAFT_465292 [Xylaria scruposa]